MPISRSRTAPAPGAHWATVFQSPSLTISNVVCSPTEAGCSHELCFDKDRIAFLRGGSYRKHVAGEIIVGDAASAIFYRKEESFRTSHPRMEGDQDTFLDFNESIFEEALHARESGAKSIFFRATHAVMTPIAILASRRLFWEVEAATASALQVEEEALQLLDVLLKRDAPPSHVSPMARRLANAARETLAQYPCERISLSLLAQRLNSSPFHLARVFQATHGVQLHRYQTRLRLTIALDRIAEGEGDLSGLAHECGFSSHSHFTLAFRAAFGVAPSKLRGVTTRKLLSALVSLPTSASG